jgi:hypothetical protein
MLCGYMGQTWARIHGTDGRLPIHYVPMCYRCHNKYDYETMQSKESRNKRARPGHRDYSGSRMKELWADPGWRARQIERQKAGIEKSTKR